MQEQNQIEKNKKDISTGRMIFYFLALVIVIGLVVALSATISGLHGLSNY
jgi:hypothetical protein